MPPRRCVILPAYNAAATIGPLIAALQRIGLEVVVVNDGSSDATAKIATDAGARVISHLRNRGKGMALRAGFAFALQSGCDAVITMDSDGQHDPQELPRLLEASAAAPEAVVVGQRRLDGASGMPIQRRWTNRLMSAVISALARQRIPDSQCGFRVIPCRFLAAASLRSRHFDLETELLLAACRQGRRVASVPIRTIYEGHRSHIRPVLDGWRFAWLVLRYLASPSRPPVRPAQPPPRVEAGAESASGS